MIGSTVKHFVILRQFKREANSPLLGQDRVKLFRFRRNQCFGWIYKNCLFLAANKVKIIV